MLSRSVYHDHLCHVYDVIPVLLLRQKSFVDVQLLEKNASKVFSLVSTLDANSGLFVPIQISLKNLQTVFGISGEKLAVRAS